MQSLKGHPKANYWSEKLGHVNVPRIAFLLCGMLAYWMFQSEVSVWWIPAMATMIYVMVPRFRRFLDSVFFDRFDKQPG